MVFIFKIDIHFICINKKKTTRIFHYLVEINIHCYLSNNQQTNNAKLLMHINLKLHNMLLPHKIEY